MKSSSILFALPVIAIIIVALGFVLDIDAIWWLPALVLVAVFGGGAYMNARKKEQGQVPTP